MKSTSAPFYQVLIAVEPEPKKLCVAFVDLSQSQLKTQFIQPYLKGTNIVAGNDIYSTAAIRRVHVIRTARENEVERQALYDISKKQIEEFNQQPGGPFIISPGHGYGPADILETGEDVTAEFVIGPPGHATHPGIFSRMFNNAWAVGIGTGLVVAIAVWFFNLQ